MSGRLKGIAAAINANAGRISHLSLAALFLGFCLLDKSLHRNLMYLAFPFWIMALAASGGFGELLRSPLVRSLGVLYALANLSLLWSDPLVFDEAFATVKSTVFGAGFVLLLLSLPGERDIERLVRLYVIGAAAAVVIAAVEFYLQYGFSAARLTLDGRGANPNVAGFLIGSSLVAYVSLAGKPAFRSRLWTLLVPLLTLGLLATTSRSSVLATLAALIVVAWFGRKTPRVSALALTALGIIVLASAAALYLNYDRVFTRADSHRIEIWMLTFDMLDGRWLFGSGMGTGYAATVSGGYTFTGAHNLLMGTLYQLGLAGVAAFLFLICLLLKHAFEAARLNGSHLPVALVVFGLAAGTFELHTVFVNLNHEWLVWLLPLSLVLRAEREAAVEPRRQAIGES